MRPFKEGEGAVRERIQRIRPEGSECIDLDLVYGRSSLLFYYKDIAMRIREEIWMKAIPPNKKKEKGGSSCMEDRRWIVG